MKAEFGFVNGFPRQVLVSVPAVGTSPTERAIGFIRENRDFYGVDDPDIGLGVRRVSAPSGAPFAVVALYQTYRGVQIHGAELNVSMFGDRILGTSGRFLTDVHLVTNPVVTAAAAEEAAREHSGAAPGAMTGGAALVIHDPSLFTEAPPHARLAWRVHLSEPEAKWVFVDASSGEIVDEEPLVVADFELELNDAENEASATTAGCYWASDETVVGDEDGYDPDYADDADAVNAWTYSRQTYEFFANTFDRDGWDGDGEEVELYIHTDFVGNAFWQSGSKCDLIEFADGYVARDIMTHEFTHAVNDYGAILGRRNASGALNESMADTFAFLQTGNGLVGGTLTNGPIRNFANPDSPPFNHPDQWTERLMDSADKGQVHRNAGIPNRAAYLLAEGGTHTDTNVTVQGIGKARMGYLYYWALAYFLPAGGDVFDLRKTLLDLAEGFGYLDSEKCAIKNAFGAVGVGDPDNDCDGVLDTTNDPDGDFVKDPTDNCPTVKNPSQSNLNGDAEGDACDADDDGDGVDEIPTPPQLTGDNCPGVANPDQLDADFDRIGAACDATEDGDLDNDQVLDVNDNCPLDYNPREVVAGDPGEIELVQPDSDSDGEGDACDPDMDDDGVGDNFPDNCVGKANADQADADGDGLGDACDACPASADSGTAWGSTVIPTLDGDVVVTKPIAPDGDDDGVPDACDPGGFGIDATVEIDGNPWDIGLMPKPGDGDHQFTVTGRPSGSIDLPLLLCELICEPTPPAEACGALSFDGFVDDLFAVVIDDRGFAVGSARGDATRDLRFNPQGGRTYSLHLVLGPQFPGRADLTMGHERCTIGDRNPQPFKGPPGAGPTPSTAPPTPGPATRGELTFTVDGATRTMSATCRIGEFPADMGGGFAFNVSATEQRADGDLDYFALVMDITDPADPDGTYTEGFGTATFADGGFNIGNLSLTIRDDGATGEFSGTKGGSGGPISGSFMCGAL